MKRASYRDAVNWLAYNDDNHWLTDEYGSLSVTAALVADIFGVTTERVTADLRRAIERMERKRK
jgi:hypothetical protein